LTPVLLLHGQPGSAGDWDGVVAAIGSRAPTIAIDRPGWDGASRASDLSGNATAALMALDRHGIGRATVVGHSFGGAVGAWLAVHHPGRVESLVLAAPAANVASLFEVDRWLAAPVIGYVASAAALSGAGAALTAAPLRRRIARGLAIDERYLTTAGRRLLTPAAWRAFVHEQRALIRDLPVLDERLAKIAAPTTIVAGSADHVIPSASVRQLAVQIPGAQLRTLEHAGHLLHLQNAASLAEIIVSTAGRGVTSPG
jgi:3-oxoadipate enol-lactonase / 4-carboxymuconolactone decarboxylase